MKVRLYFVGIMGTLGLSLFFSSCSLLQMNETSRVSDHELQEYNKYPVIQEIINGTLDKAITVVDTAARHVDSDPRGKLLLKVVKGTGKPVPDTSIPANFKKSRKVYDAYVANVDNAPALFSPWDIQIIKRKYGISPNPMPAYDPKPYGGNIVWPE